MFGPIDAFNFAGPREYTEPSRSTGYVLSAKALYRVMGRYDRGLGMFFTGSFTLGVAFRAGN